MTNREFIGALALKVELACPNQECKKYWQHKYHHAYDDYETKTHYTSECPYCGTKVEIVKVV